MKYYILGPFVHLRSNTLTLKETNPLYPHCLISEPGFSFVEGGSLMVGLKFLDTVPTHRDRVPFNDGFQFACCLQ